MGVKIHFLNVGQGDCTIVHFPKRKCGNKEKPERIMMIDIYNTEEHKTYENVIEYYKNNFKEGNNIKSIFRYVCTHPHQDHICGLAKLFKDNDIKIINFWDIDHEWEPENFDGHPTHEEDWKKYKMIKNDKSVTVLKLTRESNRKDHWDINGDNIKILNPSTAMIKRAHFNENGEKKNEKDIEIDEISYALLINVNDKKIILAGDGRADPVWEDIYTNCKDDIKNCNLLKAGHHGHETSFHLNSIKLMDPEIIIFSNTDNIDENNGAEENYNKYTSDTKILKTSDYGTIIVDIPFGKNEKIKAYDTKGKIIY